MKNSIFEITQIADVYNLDNMPVAKVLEILTNSYQLECAKGATELSMHEWLKERASFPAPEPGWWEKQEGMYEFRGEIEYYCNHMPLEDAIDEALIEWNK